MKQIKKMVKAFPPFIVLLVLGGLFSCSNSSSTQISLPNSQGNLARIIFITTSRGCQCTLTRCTDAEKVLTKVLKNYPNAPTMEKVDYAMEQNKALYFVRKYSAMMLPILYLVDVNDNLLWKKDGDFNEAELIDVLNKLAVKK